MEYDDILRKLGNEMLSKMKSLLIRGGKEDSNFIKNLRIDIGEREGVIDLILNMPDYGIFIDSGRRPGKMPPQGVLLNWMSRKGIEKKAEYPIRRKIGEKGIKPVKFLHIYDDYEDKIFNILKKGDNIEEEVDNIIEKINNL